MSQAVGRLTFNRFTEFLPILGAYIIAGNDFTRPLSGFTVYNITDSIVSTSFAGWFARWLLAQNASKHDSEFIWSVHHQPRPRTSSLLLAAAIGVLVNCSMTLIPFLLGDWYGFVAAVSIDVSVLVRWFLVSQNREAIDLASVDEDRRRSPEHVKTLCFLSDNKVVTVFVPRSVLINCFLDTPKPSRPKAYSVVQALGWLSFAAFVITIGQSSLIVQLNVVGVTLLSTLITAGRIGCEEALIGENLKACRKNHINRSGRRIETYVRLNLSKEEEDTMVNWNLVPQRRNSSWWQDYYDQKANIQTEKMDFKNRDLHASFEGVAACP